MNKTHSRLTIAQLKLVLFASFLLFGCSTTPVEQTKLVTAKHQASPKTRLTDNQVTQIETSNGIIQVEPTVVATDDSVIETQSSNTNKTVYYDPIEPVNRAIFGFNHYSYKYLLIPLAKGYNKILPDPAKRSIGNAFNNIREPLNLLNNTFSGDINDAGSNLGRFVINSTVGLLGLFDPATKWFQIEDKPKTLGQTLQTYEVGSGAYLVLPILGQSDVRNTSSRITEGLIHPTRYIFDSPTDSQVRGVGGFNSFAPRAGTYMTLYQQADDPYTYFRNQYIQSQNRNAIQLLREQQVERPATNRLELNKEQ